MSGPNPNPNPNPNLGGRCLLAGPKYNPNPSDCTFADLAGSLSEFRELQGTEAHLRGNVSAASEAYKQVSGYVGRWVIECSLLKDWLGLSAYLWVCLSVCLSVCLFVCLSVCLSVCLCSVRLCVCLPPHCPRLVSHSSPDR